MSDGTPGSESAATSFTIVAGDPTAAEVAAVTAVLGAALEELASESERHVASAPSAWQRSQRAIRTPIVRGQDSWRGFSR